MIVGGVVGGPLGVVAAIPTAYVTGSGLYLGGAATRWVIERGGRLFRRRRRAAEETPEQGEPKA